jgi:heptaprenyl diphosphate synthase
MAKKCAYYGAFLGLAIICGYVEMLIPFDFGIPGIKLGLANIVSVYILYKNGFLPSLTVNVSRIILCSLLFGNVMSLFYSLCGGVLSLLIMFAFKRFKIFSIIGVSVAGGTAHNVGQLCAASLIIGAKALTYYLPFLMLSGVITGFLIGMASFYLIKHIKTGVN